MENLFDHSLETDKQRRTMRKLGFRDFPKKDYEAKKEILGSDQRVSALEAITTTTNPTSKKEVKKGIVIEVKEKGLISAEVLKHNPVVYIGSGTDIEYPLALGGRNIIMVDPLLAREDVRLEIIKRIKAIITENPLVDDVFISFKFDFGNGPEDVKVELVARNYPYSEGKRMADDYSLPEETGVVVLYAPAGVTIDDSKVRESLVRGGVLINEYTITTKDGESTDMGS